MSREISLIVLHCADTPNGKHFTVEDIDDWHQERGFLRNEVARKTFNPTLGHIGYHYVIYIDGSVHAGRSEDEIGAHAEGYNKNSIGICMIGKDKFTNAQWTALSKLIQAKLADYPNAIIKGHYQTDTKGKTCPNFDVVQYVAEGFQPATSNILA